MIQFVFFNCSWSHQVDRCCGQYQVDEFVVASLIPNFPAFGSLVCFFGRYITDCTMGLITILSPHHQRDIICWFNCSGFASVRRVANPRFHVSKPKHCRTLPDSTRYHKFWQWHGTPQKKNEFACMSWIICSCWCRVVADDVLEAVFFWWMHRGCSI